MRPPGLGASGAALWRALVAREPALDDRRNPERVIAVEACRVRDLIDQLQMALDEHGTLVKTQRSGLAPNPALVQIGRARTQMAALIRTLRLPDETTGKRPQRSGALRGAAKPRVNRISALDRARQSGAA